MPSFKRAQGSSKGGVYFFKKDFNRLLKDIPRAKYSEPAFYISIGVKHFKKFKQGQNIAVFFEMMCELNF